MPTHPIPFNVNEFLLLLLGLVTLYYLLHFAGRTVLSLPDGGFIGAAFLCMLGAWVFTNAETYLFARFFDYLEHAFIAVSCFLLFFWCSRPRREEKGDDR